MTNQNQVIESFSKLFDNKIKENIRYIQASKFKTDYYFISHIPNGLRNKKVLDIGAFVPFDAVYWASVVKEFHAIDISEKVVNFGNEFLKKELSEAIVKKIKYKQANATNLPYEDNDFDVVFSFSTIDHIPGENNRNKVFSEIARVTKSKGYVIITLPNKLNIYSYQKSLKKQEKGTSPFGLEVFYTPKDLKKLLIKNNLKPIFFDSSSGDKGGGLPRISSLYNIIFKKFGRRMGWLAQKI